MTSEKNVVLSRPALTAKKRHYTFGEELVNSISHGIGAALSIAALVLLIVKAAICGPEQGYAECVVGYTIFGASLVILYLMSTLYHSLSFTRAEKVFQILDHSAIYILIAGSYSAFALTILLGPLGWTIFGVNWGLAILGITLEAVWGCRLQRLSLTLYLLMGWLILLAIKPLIASMPPLSLTLLAAGGVSYTLGCVFFVMKNRFMHGVWHFFVLAGSALHFFAAYFLLPLR